MTYRLLVCLLALAVSLPAPAKDKKEPKKTPLDLFIEESMSQQAAQQFTTTPGSLWVPGAMFGDISSDIRARRVGDVVTILVSESASAITSGAVQATRSSSVDAGVSAIGGITRAAGPLANLAGASSDTKLNGAGTTSRETQISATLAARVSHVLPNGLLVLEGYKTVTVNSENQVIEVRGVVRPVDLTTGNVVSTDRIAQLEVTINGKGVVGDSIRRPFILYRILLGLLPF